MVENVPEYVPGMVRLYGEHTELWYDPKRQEFSVWSGIDWHVWRGSLDQLYAQLQQASLPATAREGESR